MTKTKPDVKLDPQLVERGREYVRKRYGKNCRIETIYKHASGGGDWHGHRGPSWQERDAFKAAIWKGNIVRGHSYPHVVYRWVSDAELAEIKAKRRAAKAKQDEENRKRDRLRQALQDCPQAKPCRAYPNDPDDTEIDPDRFRWYGATVRTDGWEATATIELDGVGKFHMDAEHLATCIEAQRDVIDAFRVAVEQYQAKDKDNA